MNLFKRKPSTLEVTPLWDLDQTSIQHKIVHSVEQLNINPERSYIVGSAALTLYGIIPPQIGFNDERPSDVDMSIDTSIVEYLHAYGTTPSGINAVRELTPPHKNHVIFRTSSTSDTLPVDLINRFPDSKERTPAEYDDNFRRHMDAHTRAIPGTDVRVASPDYLRATLRGNAQNRYDSKYPSDLRAFNAYEAKQRRAS